MLVYIRILWQLLCFGSCLRQDRFHLLQIRVQNFPRSLRLSTPATIERICRAVDMVCLWYPKRVQCLQRSAATACVLRTYGVQAEMVIGVQILPFRAHAWVEVDGSVVNDKPYTREMYRVLEPSCAAR